MTLVQRLVRVLIDPRRSFEAVVNRETVHDWLMPMMVVCAAGMLAHFLTLDVMTNLETPEVQEALSKMTEEQKEQYLQGMQMLRTHGWLMVPVGVLSSLVMVSAVMLVLTRRLFSEEVTFRQMLVVKAYAAVVLIPEWLVRTPLVLITGDAGVRTGPGAFLDQSVPHDFVGRVLNTINLFDFWQMWILAAGVAVYGGGSRRKAGIALLVLWLMWIVVGALLEGVGGGTPPPG